VLVDEFIREAAGARGERRQRKAGYATRVITCSRRRSVVR
jgi:hypothetical protein